MIKIPGGKYLVGTNTKLGYPIDNEGPRTQVEIESFYIDETAVTNLEFAKFVKETGYITEAEIIGRSFVFSLLVDEKEKQEEVEGLNWWLDLEGASWRFPFGDDMSYLDILDHPVVHVTQHDALMYCKWADKRLPTEVEWEIALRAGDDRDLVFPWGDELFDEIHRANVWQGTFPMENTTEDGYLGTAPVDAFYTNDYGIKQMLGNVWEMCSNQAHIPLNEIKTETITQQIETYHKNEFLEYAAKGGSFLCHESYCNRYRTAARNGIDKLSASSNKGFRCVK